MRWSAPIMEHTVTNKTRLLNRTKRTLGQLTAVLRAIDADAACTDVMERIVTVRGAIDGLMAQVHEDHVREHMIDARRKPTAAETRAAAELVAVIKKYLR